MEVGRLIAVPVFAFFMTINLLKFYGNIRTAPLTTTAGMARLIHHFLVIAFYAIVILL